MRRAPRLAAVVALWACGLAPPGAPAQVAPRVIDAGDALFDRGEVPRLRIEVGEEELRKLREDPRRYVRATIREGDRIVYTDVALKLKGAAGSFRDWDDRPALTLNMGKLREGKGKGTDKAGFHGLKKFHLNNSVQDETYLNELLCSELFLRAGVPTARATHARVWLNGRDVGLYVLKEGFDDRFLRRRFPDPTGNLYDSGFLQDIDTELEKDEGAGPDDRSDLRAVVEAARDPDPEARRKRLEARVDLDAFLTFMAMERLTGHWDGYSNKANNYRVYFDPRRGGRAVFLPHGMDQMFWEGEAPLFGDSETIVASVVLRNDALRKRYRKRVEELLPLFDPPGALIRRVDELERRLRPVLEAMGPEAAAGHRQQVEGLKGRIEARAADLRRQVAEREPEPQGFDDRGIARLGGPGWWTKSEGEAALLEEAESAPGRKGLTILASPDEPCVASWRRDVILGPGTYLLRADARAEGVVALDNEEATGVGVGISGTPREQHLHGTSARRPLEHRFVVNEERSRIQMVLELRAKAGRVWFDLDSLTLTREGPAGTRR